MRHGVSRGCWVVKSDAALTGVERLGVALAPQIDVYVAGAAQLRERMSIYGARATRRDTSEEWWDTAGSGGMAARPDSKRCETHRTMLAR